MRAVLLPLVLACAVAPLPARPADDPKDKLAFDPKDAAATGRWLAAELARVADFAKGNEIAAKRANDAHRELLAGLKGKTVEWVVEVEKVTADGRVRVKLVTFKDGRARNARTFHVMTAGGGDAADRLRFDAAGKAGLEKLKAGDRVTLTGTVAAAEPLSALAAGDPTGYDQFVWLVVLEKYDLRLPK
jgi:hypothetical protein